MKSGRRAVPDLSRNRIHCLEVPRVHFLELRLEAAGDDRPGCIRGARLGRLRDVEEVISRSADRRRAVFGRGELMQPERLRELQRRGRVFYEMCPGAKVSDD